MEADIIKFSLLSQLEANIAARTLINYQVSCKCTRYHNDVPEFGSVEQAQRALFNDKDME